MSLDSTKTSLLKLLNDSANKVIALTGKWGSGKTHMWQELKSASTDEAVKNALTTSLFGVRNINEVKLNLMRRVAEGADSSTRRNLAKIGGAGKAVFSQEFRTGSLLEELAVMSASAVLKDRFIVLDNMERVNEKFPIDALLGFIDEFSREYGVRFLLVLNRQRDVWQNMREKIVDHELGIYSKTLMEQHGAQFGKCYGHVNDSFAILTKNELFETLDFDLIEMYIQGFLAYATGKRKLTFIVNRLPGLRYSQVAPLFKHAPTNCQFDEAWKPYLGDSVNYWGTHP